MEDVDAVQIDSLDPGENMVPQKVLINVVIDSFTSANENDQTFLAIAAHHP
jgi:hypothetical protein